jgi:hypothetical protein
MRVFAWDLSHGGLFVNLLADGHFLRWQTDGGLMPNWCFNRLTIDATTKGGKILANAFKPKYEDNDGNLYAKPFSDLMPCPKDLDIDAGFFGSGTERDEEMQKLYASNKEKYGYTHWYDWQIAKWGTKWDANVVEYDDSDPMEDIYVYFDTAWCPPVEFFRWFSEQYPDAIFEDEYDEEGMQFAGRVGANENGFFDESWDMEEENVSD